MEELAQYHERRAALRAAGTQREEMRKALQENSSAMERLQVEGLEEVTALQKQLQVHRDRVHALEAELAHEKASSARRMKAEKQARAGAAQRAEHAHAVDALRHASEKGILRQDLADLEDEMSRFAVRQARVMEEVRASHAAEVKARAERWASKLADQSAVHRERVAEVIRSEQAWRHEHEKARQRGSALEAELEALRAQAAAASGELATEGACIRAIAVELRAAESALEWAQVTSAEQRASLRTAMASAAAAAERQLDAAKRTARDQGSTHRQQLAAIEDRVRAVVASKDAEITSLREQLHHSMRELEQAHAALAIVAVDGIN